ncbi:hypothetical protein ABU178_11740 [Pantoea osteomyelitidis]|uniref:Type 1 fimbrial protein n=1 Tax=Pantoea osteomyelitidis TaxID=3230026 RepID=A0ABW7PWY3_9GAMM
MYVRLKKKKIFFLKTIFPAVFFSALSLPMTAAADTGTVHFQGKIVEDGCETSGADTAPRIRCYRQGKWLSQPIMMKADTQGYLPGNIGTTQLRWIDKDKKLAIMTISYR